MRLLGHQWCAPQHQLYSNLPNKQHDHTTVRISAYRYGLNMGISPDSTPILANPGQVHRCV